VGFINKAASLAAFFFVLTHISKTVCVLFLKRFKLLEPVFSRKTAPEFAMPSGLSWVNIGSAGVWVNSSVFPVDLPDVASPQSTLEPASFSPHQLGFIRGFTIQYV
jgi:hypothetical protein